MNAEDFILAYQEALASHSWTLVEPLVHEDACVTFSNGAVHKGQAAVRAAYEGNFGAIEDEDYRISNVHRVWGDESTAVFLFDFAWSGHIGGRAAEGGGRGTSVLVRDGCNWKLLVEHLGPNRA